MLGDEVHCEGLYCRTELRGVLYCDGLYPNAELTFPEMADPGIWWWGGVICREVVMGFNSILLRMPFSLWRFIVAPWSLPDPINSNTKVLSRYKRDLSSTLEHSSLGFVLFRRFCFWNHLNIKDVDVDEVSVSMRWRFQNCKGSLYFFFTGPTTP